MVQKYCRGIIVDMLEMYSINIDVYQTLNSFALTPWRYLYPKQRNDIETESDGNEKNCII